MRYVGSSDRNFYDRCYFNAGNRSNELFLITGLGVYPNLGVIDAYATVRKGDRQWAVRCSDALERPGHRRPRRPLSGRGAGAAIEYPVGM